jgi:hypothetical protein
MSETARGAKVLWQALWVAVGCAALCVTVGTAPAEANHHCTGTITFTGNTYGSWQAAGVSIVEPPNDWGFGAVRQHQRRTHTRHGYKTCRAQPPYRADLRYHRHYKQYHWDTRSQYCPTYLYVIKTCGIWSAPTHWPPHTTVYVSWHWL